MIMILLMLAGTIPDGSAGAQVYVLPQVGRIATLEPGAKAVQFYNLDGRKYGNFPIAGELQVLCEAQGLIFLTVSDTADSYDLLITDAALRAPRVIRKTTFYYPNVVDGRIYALDRLHIRAKEVDYPRLATLFEPDKLRYGQESFFKLPPELIDQSGYPKRFWILSFGRTKLAFIKGSFSAYQLDEEYLGREKVSDESLPTPFHTVLPTGAPGDPKLQGKFRLPRLMSCEKAAQLYNKWLTEREVLFEVWSWQDQILIAYGSYAQGTKLGYLDGRFDFHPLGTHTGIAVASHENQVWFVDRSKTKTMLSQRKFQLSKTQGKRASH